MGKDDEEQSAPKDCKKKCELFQLSHIKLPLTDSIAVKNALNIRLTETIGWGRFHET